MCRTGDGEALLPSLPSAKERGGAESRRAETARERPPSPRRAAPWRSRLAFVLLVLLAAPARGEDAFYGAVGGNDLALAWTADPTDLSRDGETTLTLAVRNARNPQEVRRPPLRDLPAFRDRFQVIDRPDPPAGPGDQEVRFTWTLRPRVEGTVEVPSLRFDFRHVAGGKVRTKYTDPIPLTVRPAAPAAAPGGPVLAPERFFHLPDEAELTRRPLAPPGPWHWAGLLAAVALATAGWVLLWRRRNPGGARLARLRRVRAVRRALDALARAGESADPAAHAAEAVRVYLIERHGLPPVGPVPGEIEAAARAAGLPADRVTTAAEFFRACDEARFDDRASGGRQPPGEGARHRGADAPRSPDPVAAARELVLAWEAAA